MKRKNNLLSLTILYSMVYCFVCSVFILSVPGKVLAQPKLKGDQLKVKQYSEEELENKLDSVETVLKKLRRLIDRTSFDTEALLEELDYDVAAIVRFVEQQIVFQAYQGVSRGAKGALLAGAGNAFDQALLLATLLKDAGFDARIAETKLSKQQAMSLVKTALKAQPVKSGFREKVFTDSDAALDLLRSAMPAKLKLTSLQTSIQNVQEEFYKSASGDIRALTNKIEQALSKDFSFQRPFDVTSLTRYAFVEYRTSPGESFKSSHPALDGADVSGFSELKAEKYWNETVPEDLLEHFVLNMSIQTKENGKVLDKPVMSEFRAPTANIYGRLFTLTAKPLGVGNSPFEKDFIEKVGEVSSFVPVINKKLAPSAKAFDLAGRLLDPTAAADMAAGVFKNVADKTGKAAQALNSLGSGKSRAQEELFQLQSVRIRYGIETADGKKRYRSRVSLMEPSPSAKSYSYPLVQEISANKTIVVGSGDFPAAFVLDQKLGYLIDLLPVLKMAMLKWYNPLAKVKVAERKIKMLSSAWNGMYQYFNLLNAPLSADRSVFRPYASVVVYEQSLPFEKKVFTRRDIVFSPVVGLRQDKEVVQIDKKAALKQGVYETRVEQIATSSNATSVVQTFALLNKIDSFRYLAAAEEPEKFSVQQKAAFLKGGAERGLLISSGVQKDAEALFEINPGTGSLLAIGPTGHGTNATEKILMKIGIAAGLLFGGAGLLTCSAMRNAQDLGMACCLVDAVGYGLAGFVGSLIVGLASGVVALMFIDIGFGFATFFMGTVGVLPSFCNVGPI